MDEIIVHIQWSGPYSFVEASRFQDLRMDYGVYQFCGPHTVYGRDVLLYLGKAARQTFGVRIQQEGWERWQEANGSVRVFLGRLSAGSTPQNDLWNREIDLAERLLIQAHRPAHNASGLYRTRDPDIERLHVLNWGDRGALLPEVSGARWSARFASIPGYAAYGSHAPLIAGGGASETGSGDVSGGI